MATPSSVRFEPGVLERLSVFVAAHPGLSLSSASNQLIDEALRMQEHLLIVFRDGPAGRRARLVAGPDVWEIVGAVRSAREAEPGLSGNEVIDLVAETSGLDAAEIRAALDYWGDYPDEVEVFLEQAQAEAQQARTRWRREHDLLDR
jgi:hypothetical protein